MNNRNPNKENTYSNLAAWCEKYHKDSGIKIHPSSVPVDLVLEDLMGYIAHLNAGRVQLIGALDHAVARIDELDKQVHELNVQFVELESKTGHTNFKTADDIQEEWKENNKPVTKKVKK